MNRQDPHAEKASQKPAPSDPRNDERWLGDLPNDLAAISLSSDEPPAAVPEAWDCADLSQGRPEAPHRHEDVGI